MPLFLCRWPNGDCSVVLARTKEDAIIELDQVGNAGRLPDHTGANVPIAVRPHRSRRAGAGAVRRRHERGSGLVRLPAARERARRGVPRGRLRGYESLPPDRRAAIARAVEQEWNRLDLEKTATTEPRTELGRDVKSRTDMPTILIDRLVRKRATQKLRNFKGRGKPS